MPEPINPYEPPAAAEPSVIARRHVPPNKAMRRLVLGLGILLTGQFLFAAGIIGWYAGFTLARGFHFWGAALRLEIFSNVLQEVGKALALIGGLFCLATPSESKALGWIQASVITAILAWVVLGAGYVPGVVRGTHYLELVLEYASKAATLVFVLRLSDWLQRSDFARRATNLLKLFGAGIGLNLFRHGLVFLMHHEIAVPRSALTFASAAVDVLLLVVAVKFIQLVSDIRAEIQAGWESPDTLPE